jgi:hypothetical protein
MCIRSKIGKSRPLFPNALKTLTAMRTTVFARVASVATACELLSPLVGSALMLKDPWIPVTLGFATFLLGASTTLALLPETLTRRVAPIDAPDTHTSPKTHSFKLRDLGDQTLAMFAVFRQCLVSLFAIKNVVFLLFGFFAATVGSLAAGFELQYVHKRYGWSYSYVSLSILSHHDLRYPKGQLTFLKAGSILAIRPSITLFVLLIIIPVASKILIEKFGFSSTEKDLLLARISAALLTAGTLLLSITEISSLAILSFIIFAFGNAFTTVGKSLLTTLGPREMAGTLLSAMNVSASLGAVIAGPTIAYTFDLGLRRGGIWIGAPLFFVTLLYALTLGSVCIMNAPEERDDDLDDEQEAQD